MPYSPILVESRAENLRAIVLITREATPMTPRQPMSLQVVIEGINVFPKLFPFNRIAVQEFLNRFALHRIHNLSASPSASLTRNGWVVKWSQKCLYSAISGPVMNDCAVQREKVRGNENRLLQWLYCLPLKNGLTLSLQGRPIC